MLSATAHCCSGGREATQVRPQESSQAPWTGAVPPFVRLALLTPVHPLRHYPRSGLGGALRSGLWGLWSDELRRTRKDREPAVRPDCLQLLGYILSGELAMAFEHGDDLDALRFDSIDDPVASLDDFAQAGSGKLRRRSAHTLFFRLRALRNLTQGRRHRASPGPDASQPASFKHLTDIPSTL